MRPGTKVNPPAMTRAPTKRNSIAFRCLRTLWRRAAVTATGRLTTVKSVKRCIALKGPNVQVVLTKSELTATTIINATHVQPTIRCPVVPFGLAS